MSIQPQTACTRCGLNPRAPGQRWCQPCKSDHRRVVKRTALRTAASHENSGAANMAPSARGNGIGVAPPRQVPAEKGRPTPPPPASYVPFTGAASPRETWYAPFLSDLAIRSSPSGPTSATATCGGLRPHDKTRR
jgi:hypothetical protein